MHNLGLRLTLGLGRQWVQLGTYSGGPPCGVGRKGRELIGDSPVLSLKVRGEKNTHASGSRGGGGNERARITQRENESTTFAVLKGRMRTKRGDLTT